MLKVTILVCRLRYSNGAEQTTVYVSGAAFLLSAGCADVGSFSTNIEIVDLERKKRFKTKSVCSSKRVWGASVKIT